MLSLIRMNMYRFWKSKFVIGLLIVAVCTAIFTFGMTDPEESAQDRKIMEEAGMDEGEDSFGIVVSYIAEPDFVNVMEEIFHSGLLLVVISVYAVIFASGEKNSGFLKNIVLPKRKRMYLFLAKIIPVSMFSLLCFGVAIIVVAGFLGIGSIMGFLPTLFVQLLLHISFGVFALAYMEVFRNQAIGLVIAIFGSMGIHVLLVSLLEGVLNGMGVPVAILFGKNMIVSAVKTVSCNLSSTLFPCTLTAVFGIILYGIMGSVIFSKRDL